MSWEIIGLAIIVALVILAIIFRKTSFVKKYWKYLLILVPAAIVLVLKIMQDAKNKKKEGDSQASSTTQTYIQEIKEQITEVQTVAKVEAAIAKTKNDATMQELKEVQAIDDGRERRRRLAAMIG